MKNCCVSAAGTAIYIRCKCANSPAEPTSRAASSCVSIRLGVDVFSGSGAELLAVQCLEGPEFTAGTFVAIPGLLREAGGYPLETPHEIRVGASGQADEPKSQESSVWAAKAAPGHAVTASHVSAL
jgi:hypothetical protein